MDFISGPVLAKPRSDTRPPQIGARSREEPARHRASWAGLVTTSPTFLLILCQLPGNAFADTCPCFYSHSAAQEVNLRVNHKMPLSLGTAMGEANTSAVKIHIAGVPLPFNCFTQRELNTWKLSAFTLYTYRKT